jgi:hypothetical protein
LAVTDFQTLGELQMATTTKKVTESKQKIVVTEVTRKIVSFHVVGTSAFIANRMSAKAMSGLLLPKGRMTAADKAGNIKHEPREEFKNSVYTLPDKKAPTYVAVPSAAFKRAIASAALDVPGGAKKAQVGRLSWIENMYSPLFGIPQLYMAVVRSADMNRTPDIRTRAIFPRWATRIEVSYIEPAINPTTLSNLLLAAGLIIGVGDGRQEKGALSFGQFRVVQPDDAEYLDIIEEGGRAAQIQALEDCNCFDDESERLLKWWDGEIDRRGVKGAA